jgi:hypothetical protein
MIARKAGRSPSVAIGAADVGLKVAGRSRVLHGCGGRPAVRRRCPHRARRPGPSPDRASAAGRGWVAAPARAVTRLPSQPAVVADFKGRRRGPGTVQSQ